MKIYIELWKAKESWKNLSGAERQQYLSQLEPAIQHLMQKGVEVISWGANENSTYARADYDFFGIWKFPNADLIPTFEKMIAEAGWYTYFDQVNVKGEHTSPPEVLKKLIEI